MAYFGKRSKLSHCQLNRAAVVLDLPCDPDTLRRLARANQLIYRNSVRPALGPDRYQVLSRSRGDQWYNVYLSIYDARWGCVGISVNGTSRVNISSQFGPIDRWPI